jgi:hypothetical protein
MMELRNALAICLITLFSASLVLLIARVLDVQAAARIEPQLVRIVEELEAIRKQGGIAAGQAPANAMATAAETGGDSLVVYYFYGNTRCPTCRAIESQSHDAVHSEFADELAGGELVWKTLNYELPATRPLQTKFEITMPVVVLAQLENGQIEKWNRLDRVWGLVKDESAFRDYLRDEIHAMLVPQDSTDDIPVPEF